MTFHRLLIWACLFTSLFSVFSVSSADEKPYKVGVVLGITGISDRWSKYQKMGVELAAEDLKAQGIPLKVIYEDSKSDSKTAIGIFNKFISVDKVDAVVGDTFSFVTEPLIDLANHNELLLVAPSLQPYFCSRSKGWLFSSSTQIELAKKGFADFFDLNPKVKKIALVYFDDPGWGNSYKKIWQELAKERRIEIVEELATVEYTPDTNALLPKILKRKPDAFFIAHNPFVFVKSLRNFHYSGDIVFANSLPELLVDSNFDMSMTEGVYFVDTLPSKEFTERFIEKFSEPPLLEGYNGYEALRTVVKALQINRKYPEKAVASLKYSGVSGKLDYTNSCVGNFSQWYLKVVKNGKISLVNGE